jgi:hypothetical protein
LLIRYPSFLDACGGVGSAQVATLHDHAIEAVLDAGQLRAALLHGWDDLHAHGFQPLHVLGEAAAILGRAVA